METNPSKILQQHGIEAAPDDPRSSAEIVRDMISKGIIPAVIERSRVTPDQLTGAMHLLVPLEDIVIAENQSSAGIIEANE